MEHIAVSFTIYDVEPRNAEVTSLHELPNEYAMREQTSITVYTIVDHNNEYAQAIKRN